MRRDVGLAGWLRARETSVCRRGTDGRAGTGGWLVCLWPPGSRRWAALSLLPEPGRGLWVSGEGTGGMCLVCDEQRVLALLGLELSRVALVTVSREASLLLAGLLVVGLQ